MNDQEKAGLVKRLGFHMETREKTPVIVWASGGVTPAGIAEVALWEALTGEPL